MGCSQLVKLNTNYFLTKKQTRKSNVVAQYTLGKTQMEDRVATNVQKNEITIHTGIRQLGKTQRSSLQTRKNAISSWKIVATDKDDFKKLFSEPKIAKNLLVQFCRARRDESIALKKFEKFENFLLQNEIYDKNFIHLPDLFQLSYRHVRYIKLTQIKSSLEAPNFTGSRLPVFFFTPEVL